ncbi:MAG: type I-C CRISPR-associated protein Cas5 [Thermomicrobiales bacterium]|nr:type I-C CRISPR-associated protein Cas5 [Thermomicrobiales bacterium]
MERFDRPLALKVWGDLACFTRPEMKVERVSYPVMTPSAARGVLEAIFWKPEFDWRVDEIWVLNDIRYASFVRNEVKSRASERTARTWATVGGGYAAEDDRTQRHTLALRDVAYLIRAEPEPRAGGPDVRAKYRDQFRRRVQRGQCFATPYLGCREFSAFFAPPSGDEQPLPLTTDLGRMLREIAYDADGSGRGSPRFFEARLEAGVLRVPAADEEG